MSSAREVDQLLLSLVEHRLDTTVNFRKDVAVGASSDDLLKG